MLVDEQTHFSVPDEQHACHRAKPAQLVNLAYQGRYCLAATHRDCPGYQAGWKRGLSKEARRKHSRRLSGLRSAVRWMVILLAVAAMGLLALQARAALPGPVATLAMMTQTPTAKPAATRPIATLRPSDTPTSAVTVTPTPGPLAGTPFGPENRWLVHVVEEGESLDYIAQQYGTTAEVLAAVNTSLENGLWPNTPLVVCQGCAGAEGLPRLSAVWVEEGASLDDLAALLNTTPEELKEWNGIEGDWVDGGRWIVVEEK